MKGLPTLYSEDKDNPKGFSKFRAERVRSSLNSRWRVLPALTHGDGLNEAGYQ